MTNGHFERYDKSMRFETLKLFWPLLAAAMILTLAISALPALAGIVPGPDTKLTPSGSGGPDIEVTFDDEIVALAYYKIGGGAGSVYIKSAADPEGWRTRSGPLGFSNQPPRLAGVGQRSPAKLYDRLPDLAAQRAFAARLPATACRRRRPALRRTRQRLGCAVAAARTS